MRPEPGQLLHFSHDPTITRFEPREHPTDQHVAPYVWAVTEARCPDYWFPRECPRAMFWAEPTTTAADRDRFLGPDGARVHAVEYGWLSAMRDVELYAYRLPGGPFTSLDETDSAVYGAAAQVATEPVAPLGPPQRVGDLFGLHEAAGIELRVLADLWPLWNAVVDSSLGFSGIRMRNARQPGPREARQAVDQSCA